MINIIILSIIISHIFNKILYKVCDEIEKDLKLKLEDVEIGYLAIHIERVMDNELSE